LEVRLLLRRVFSLTRKKPAFLKNFLMFITAKQLRAARALLGMGRADVATEADLSRATVDRVELLPGEFSTRCNKIPSVRRIVRVLESRGAVFLSDGVLVRRHHGGADGQISR
jgi:hypothetical protein